MSGRKRFVISTLVCPGCGNAATVPRKKSRRREVGHVKHMWCPFCEKVQPFKEVQ